MLLWPPILGHNLCHYNDVIMSAMASQITGVSIACSTICSGVDTRASNAGNISISWRHHVFWGSDAVPYFWSKVNIWNANCARATAFIFDTRTGVLAKVSKFWDRKCIDLRRTRTPNLRIHAECSNLLSYQGQTFAMIAIFILSSEKCLP